MKNKILISGLLVILVGSISVGVVSADPADVFIGETACGLFGTDMQIVVTTDSVVIQTHSTTDVFIAICKADNPFPPPEKIQVYNYENTGIVATSSGHPTTHWKSVVTPGGKLIITAISRPNSEP